MGALAIALIIIIIIVGLIGMAYNYNIMTTGQKEVDRLKIQAQQEEQQLRELESQKEALNR